MIILGLTGSIGMGKTEAAKMFRRLQVPVFDADASVHSLLGANDEAISEVAATFPGAVRGGSVDRQELGALVFDKPAQLKQLEAIIHPRVRHREQRFIADAARYGAPLAVLDIPLLFESGNQDRCDATAVVSAPAFVQRGRVLGRPGMTSEKYVAILGRQMPDEEKRRYADFVIPTGLGKRFSLQRIRWIITMLSGLSKHSISSPSRRRLHA